jgi:putative addiction module killer protein
MALRVAGCSGQGRGRPTDPTLGNPGDVRPVGEGVSELRIHYGPGYRVYFVQRGSLLIVLLCGGDKSSQAGDIASALKLAKEV